MTARIQIGPAWIGQKIAAWMLYLTSARRREVVWLPVRSSSSSYGIAQTLQPGEFERYRYG